MKAFEIILSALNLSLLLIRNPSTGSEISAECPLESGYTNNQICEKVQEMNIGNRECIERVINSRYGYDPKKQSILSALTAQYCEGTDKYKECSRCFRDVFKHHWNEHICLERLLYRMSELKECVQQYENSRFTLTLIYFKNLVIKEDFTEEKLLEREKRGKLEKKSGKLEKKRGKLEKIRPKLAETMNVYIDLSADEYKDCQNVFPADILTEDNQFVLNIYNDATNIYAFTLIEGFITLFLDAVRTKDEASFDRVKCQDILTFPLLSRYQQLSKNQIKVVPNEVIYSFKNLRKDYCKDKVDIYECQACFQPADELFMHYLFNKYKPINTVRNDFTKIQNILTDCFRKNISNEYSSLQTLIKNSERAKTWNINFGKCWGNYYGTYGNILMRNNGIIALCEHNDPFIKTIATYYFGFSIYQALNLNRYDPDCFYIKHSRILCAAGETVRFFMDFTDNIEYEHDNDILNFLAKNIGYCGERKYLIN